MDTIDHMSEREEHLLALTVKSICDGSSVKKRTPTLQCHYCEEPFNEGDSRVFCDDDCRRDHQKYIVKA